MESLERMIDERIGWGDIETALKIKWLNHDYNCGILTKLDTIGKALEHQVAGAKGVYKIERRQEWR